MPPLLALALCFGLMLYLFRIDSKSGDKVSGIFWFFSIWGMIVGSRSISDWLQIGTSYDISLSSGTESNPYNILTGVACVSISIYIIIKRKVDIGGIIRQNVPLAALFGYCFLSCTWSDDPFVSFRRVIFTLIDVIVVVALLSETDRISAIKKFFGRYSIFAMPLSIVMIKYFPLLGTSWNKSGEGVMWTGVCVHKNTLGAEFAVCILYYLWKWMILKDFKTMKVDLFLFGVAMYIMFNPAVKGSSTAQLSLIASIIILVFIKLFQNKIRMFTFIFYVLIGSYFLANTAVGFFFNTSILKSITLASGRDMTFTGRTYIWDAVLEEAAQNPIVGTGYGMFWTGARYQRLEAKPGVYDIKQAHNGYIETYAQIGIIGLILLIIVLVTSLNKRLNGISSDFQFNSLAIAFIIQNLLAEFFEATVLSAPSSRWVYLLLFMVQIPDKNTNTSTNNSGGRIAQ